MEIFAFILALLLIILSVVLIFVPLMRRSMPPKDEDPTSDWSDLGRLRDQRNAALQAVQDLDEELARGNISQEDHQSLRSSHIREAARLIRAIEGREQVLDAEIERALIRFRKRPNGAQASESTEPQDG